MKIDIKKHFLLLPGMLFIAGSLQGIHFRKTIDEYMRANDKSILLTKKGDKSCFKDFDAKTSML